MRERPALRFTARFGIGITPAHAGKTIRIAIWDELQEDHPRSCGKDYHFNLPTYTNTGSPPLVRERHFRQALFFAPVGITPARAGKTRPVKEPLRG